MAIKLSHLKPYYRAKHRGKRVGRGNNSTDSGNYCGRGLKGQRSRTGGKKGLKLKGVKSALKSFPKMKGFKRHSKKATAVGLSVLEKKFKEDEIINSNSLLREGLIKSKNQKIKILADKEIKKKLIIKAHYFSQKAEEFVKRSGGEIIKI